MTLQFENLTVRTPEAETERRRSQVVVPQLEELEVELAAEEDVPEDPSGNEPEASGFMGGATVPPTFNEARRTRIEAAIGESVSISTAQAEHIAASMRDGVTCKIHITRERLQVKNSPEEFGVDPNLARELFGGMGVKYLAPKDILGDLNSADTMARNLVAKFGIQTPWGRFIPTGNWQKFKAAFARQQANYFGAINRLIEMMEDGRHGRWVRATYTDLACDRWKTAKKNWRSEAGECWADDPGEMPPSEFVNLIVDSALSRVPPPSVILANARFEYRLDIVQAPATQLAVECATEDSELNRELVLQMNERKLSYVDDFLQAARQGLIEHVNGLVSSVNKTLSGKTTVHGKTINRILRAISDMRNLNITSDQDFEQRIEELESYIEAKQNSSGPISSAEVIQNLRATANRITEQLDRSPETTGQFANLGE